MSARPAPTSTSETAWWKFFQLIVAAVIAAVIIRVAFNTDRAFEDFDLGTDTKTSFATRLGRPNHFNRLDTKKFDEVKSDIAEAKLPLVLFVGNSQTTGINFKTEESKNYLHLLSERLIDRAFLLGHTIPNCNLQEQRAIVEFWTQKESPSILVMPLFYDDLREDGIRETYFQFVAQNTKCEKVGDRLCNQLSDIRDSSTVENSEVDEIRPLSLQEKSEALINRELDSRSVVWKNRANVRGDLLVFLYQLRNTAFRISPQSKRKMIAANEKTNLEALDEILAAAKTHNVHVLAYIAPLRQDIDPPYDMNAYRKFKELMSTKFVGEFDRFVDLDAIVPGQYWGMKNSTNLSGTPEYDFMHFRQEGHDRLADAVLPILSEMIEQL